MGAYNLLQLCSLHFMKLRNLGGNWQRTLHCTVVLFSLRSRSVGRQLYCMHPRRPMFLALILAIGVYINFWVLTSLLDLNEVQLHLILIQFQIICRVCYNNQRLYNIHALCTLDC
ncbi:hypothetical protein BVRB_4g089960 [Beta vulgaris subsp. vulgaris]|nr:hypothetical protein BVRB_4g089960 [Beta vulgaris subsp. vulgaris]